MNVKPGFNIAKPSPDDVEPGFKSVKPSSFFQTVGLGFVVLLLGSMVLLP